MFGRWGGGKVARVCGVGCAMCKVSLKYRLPSAGRGAHARSHTRTHTPSPLQILRHGFFHADPHPGNVAVDPTSGRQPVLLFYGEPRNSCVATAALLPNLGGMRCWLPVARLLVAALHTDLLTCSFAHSYSTTGSLSGGQSLRLIHTLTDSLHMVPLPSTSLPPPSPAPADFGMMGQIVPNVRERLLDVFYGIYR